MRKPTILVGMLLMLTLAGYKSSLAQTKARPNFVKVLERVQLTCNKAADELEEDVMDGLISTDAAEAATETAKSLRFLADNVDENMPKVRANPVEFAQRKHWTEARTSLIKLVSAVQQILKFPQLPPRSRAALKKLVPAVREFLAITK